METEIRKPNFPWPKEKPFPETNLCAKDTVNDGAGNSGHAGAGIYNEEHAEDGDADKDASTDFGDNYHLKQDVDNGNTNAGTVRDVEGFFEDCEDGEDGDYENENEDAREDDQGSDEERPETLPETPPREGGKRIRSPTSPRSPNVITTRRKQRRTKYKNIGPATGRRSKAAEIEDAVFKSK